MRVEIFFEFWSERSEAEKRYGNDDGEFTNERHTRERVWTRRILISKRMVEKGVERVGSGEEAKKREGARPSKSRLVNRDSGRKVRRIDAGSRGVGREIIERRVGTRRRRNEELSEPTQHELNR